MDIPAPPRSVDPEVEVWMQAVRTMLTSYVFIPMISGAPTTPPVDQTRAALLWDYTNNRLYVYSPGTGWRYATTV
jgi:hypothetical protein